MFLPRIIPVLLLKGKGIVKTVKFKEPRYIGDPINAVRIFNDLKADELLFLDITATLDNRCISKILVKDIGDEAFMPFGVGGGIKTVGEIEMLLKAGAEKVIINSEASTNSQLIESAAKIFGSQSITVSIDIKKSFFGYYNIYTHSGTKKNGNVLENYVKNIENLGAGELFINSINNDGMMDGYDIDLIKRISELIKIPLVACGGAANLKDMKNAYYNGKAHSLAAGSMFVYHGPRNAILINYPTKQEVIEEFEINNI